VRDAGALRYLRRRTLWRALAGYLRWIGKAVGWTSIVYLLFWLVVYLVSGVQLLTPLAEPLPATLLRHGAAVAAALLLLYPALFSRAPPVVLNRRDLYRLGLAPVVPADALAWPLWSARILRFIQGATLGLFWSIIAYYWFAQPAPWAALAGGLLFSLQLELAWLSYTERQTRQIIGLLLTLTACLLSLLGLHGEGWGLASAFYLASPWTLFVPALLAVLAALAVRASLLEHYPPRFCAQSLVLAELRAASLLTSTLLKVAPVDKEQRRRLLTQLHDRPVARLLMRKLRAPPPHWGALGAFAWRSALTLYRRPWLSQLGLLFWLAAVAVASLDLLGGVVGLMVYAFVLAQALTRLTGPDLLGAPLPVAPLERTLGRILPGAAVAAAGVVVALLFAGAAGLAVSPLLIVTVATQPFLGLVILDKLSSWLGMSHERLEVLAVASLLTLTPGLVAAALGLTLLLPSTHLLLGWLIAHVAAAESR
jgi:hypothetical protein